MPSPLDSIESTPCWIGCPQDRSNAPFPHMNECRRSLRHVRGSWLRRSPSVCLFWIIDWFITNIKVRPCTNIIINKKSLYVSLVGLTK
uniref:Uncharacterized protein n=1 Tax=Vitrella brassicaformis TaxID=1169539 RepID=A0A7S1K2V2_9ALVE